MTNRPVALSERPNGGVCHCCGMPGPACVCWASSTTCGGGGKSTFRTCAQEGHGLPSPSREKAPDV